MKRRPPLPTDPTQLREIAARAADVLDFLDEARVGDWPAPMRLRHALYPESKTAVPYGGTEE